MVDIGALRIELAKPAYVGLSDAACVPLVRAVTSSTTLRSFSPMEIFLSLVKNGDMGWLSGVATGYVTSANASGAGAVAVAATTPWLTRRTADTLLRLIERPWPVDTVMLTSAGMQSALDILVTANVIKAATRTEIMNLTSAPVFPFGDADQHDVWLARGQV